MSGRFDITDTPLAGLKLLQRRPVGDERGWLERLYCDDDLEPVLGERTIAQANRTLTRRRGAVRGLHFQRPPYAETKLVACLRGSVFDVAVDLRRGSPTFLRWHAEILSADNHRTLLIPEGFAHGFQALDEDCEMLYFHTAAHAPHAESGVHAQDPALAIAWPLPVGEMSARDAAHPWIDDAFEAIAP